MAAVLVVSTQSSHWRRDLRLCCTTVTARARRKRRLLAIRGHRAQNRMHQPMFRPDVKRRSMHPHGLGYGSSFRASLRLRIRFAAAQLAPRQPMLSWPFKPSSRITRICVGPTPSPRVLDHLTPPRAVTIRGHTTGYSTQTPGTIQNRPSSMRFSTSSDSLVPCVQRHRRSGVPGIERHLATPSFCLLLVPFGAE